MKIAILGAPGSGASALAALLRSQLQPANAYTVVTALVHPWDRVDLVLLMGLAPGCTTEQRVADQALRATLGAAALPYTLVYGTGTQACGNALQAIRYQRRDTAGLPQATSRWRWPCEKCSDPACEHRLFSGLLLPPEPV